MLKLAPRRIVRRCLSGFKYFAIFLISFSPIASLFFYLRNNGSNNISNDNLLIVPLIDKILNHSYPWAHFPRDVFFNDHFQFFSIITQLLIAKYFHFDIRVILGLGIVLALVRLALLFDAITCSSRAPAKYYWLIPLSFLVFSPSQLPTFESDWNTIMVGLTQAGVALGIWGIAKYRPNRAGVILMALGGVAASFSSGMGPLAWPAFLLALLLSKYKRLSSYVTWGFAALVSVIPYVYFRFVSPVVRPYDNPKILHPFSNYKLLIQALGWPFKQGMSLDSAYAAGWVGVLFGFLGLMLVLARRKEPKVLEGSATSLMLMLWGLVTAMTVVVFRGDLTPWYAAFFMPFWVGLLGLAFHVWENRRAISLRLSVVWVSSFFSFVAFFYVSSAFYLRENRFFAEQRSPVAASCLRSFQTAPTYCAQKLFSWDINRYEEFVNYARALQDNFLSVFGPRQIWSLQGDFFLDKVSLFEQPGIPRIFWTPDLSSHSESFAGAAHLNLFMHSPNAIEWKMTLPRDLKSATLFTAFSISQSAPFGAGSDGAVFTIVAKTQDGRSQALVSQYLPPEQRNWVPARVSLTRFAGQALTLRIGSEGLENYTHDWTMFRHPYVEIQLASVGARPQEQAKVVPENTELNPGNPTPKANDFLFSGDIRGQWTSSGIAFDDVSNPQNFRATQADPWMQYNLPVNLSLKDFSHFFIRISAQEKIIPRYLQVYYKLNGQDTFEESHSFKIPLLSDGEMHSYFYDLKLLELDTGDVLTGIRLDPVPELREGAGNAVSLAEFRLIHK